MNRNKMQTRCTLLAVAAPLAHFAGAGYMAVFLAAGAMLPLTMLAGDGLKRITKPEAALELLWIGLVLGSVMGTAGGNWPGNQSEIVVPLAVLALAWISGKGEKSMRSCSALFWIAAVPVVPVMAALAGTVELDLLGPEPANWTGGLIAALLFPALNGTEKGVSVGTAAASGITAVIIAAIVQGGLGITTAKNAASPLYELGRCVGNGGFEIIVSVVLTLGWYGFASMGMRAAEAFGKILGLSEAQSRTAAGLTAGLIMVSNRIINDRILISGCLILWVLVPLLHPEK